MYSLDCLVGVIPVLVFPVCGFVVVMLFTALQLVYLLCVRFECERP
jgi:hypothetical protein